MLPGHDLIGRDREHVGKLGESQALVDAELRLGISDRMPDDVRRLGRARLAATIRTP